MRRWSAAALCIALAGTVGCSSPATSPDSAPTRATFGDLPLPPARSFAGGSVLGLSRSNGEMADDIADLVFRLESGRSVPMLTRFDGPITVRMTGRVPPNAAADLGRLLGRLRAEAGLDITSTSNPGASITIEFLPRATMNGLVPQAACFVAPRVTSWSEYRQARRRGGTDWTTLTRRDHASVFIPSDTAPQEVRDCLHEEMAQALGPLNDLYRLPDSVFNDDNMHGVLTGFDMLVLRVIYSPALVNGMSEGEVRARLPDILSAINPGGGFGGGSGAGDDTPRGFVDAIEAAIGGRASIGSRRAAAMRAVAIAEAAGWQDARTGFAHLLLGRLALASEPDLALRSLARAGTIYSARGYDIQAAHVDMQLAAFALTQGDAEGVLDRTSRALQVATAAENAGLMASLMMVKAEALDLLGRTDEAADERRASLGWARYGFGSAADVQARLGDIAALNPARRSVLR